MNLKMANRELMSHNSSWSHEELSFKSGNPKAEDLKILLIYKKFSSRAKYWESDLMQGQFHHRKAVLEDQGGWNKTFLAFKDSPVSCNSIRSLAFCLVTL